MSSNLDKKKGRDLTIGPNLRGLGGLLPINFHSRDGFSVITVEYHIT